MTLSEKIDDLVDKVNKIHTLIAQVDIKLDYHTNPDQPCVKVTEYAKEHFEEEHKNFTLKVLGLFGGIVIFAFAVYEGVTAILERGK